jgi:hypothetical protein
MRNSWIGILICVLGLTGCGSEAPKKAAETKTLAKAPEPVTGRFAVHQCFTNARGWAPDAELLKVENIRLKAVPDAPGKSGAWRMVFVSPSRGRQRSCTWSAIEGEGLYKGVFAGHEESYTPGRTPSFILLALKIDTDAAYETTLKQKRTEEFRKKFPNTPVLYLLERNSRFPNPVWRIVFGDSIATSQYSAYVDATSGDYQGMAR